DRRRLSPPVFEASTGGLTPLRSPDKETRTMPAPLPDAAVREYHANGFHLARGFFDAEEIDLLKRSAREDNELDRRSFGRADGEGGVVRLSLGDHPGDGIYVMFARCARVVRSAEEILGDELLHD